MINKIRTEESADIKSLATFRSKKVFVENERLKTET